MRATVLIASALLLLPSAALAAALAGQARFAAGQEAFAEGDFERALAELEAAANQARDDALLAQIHLLRGRCYAALPDTARAEEAFTLALEHDPEARLDPGKVRPSIVAALDGLRERLRAELLVHADRPAVVVTFDGAELGRAPIQTMVAVGRHVIEARTADGRFAEKQTVVIRPRRSHDLWLKLAQADPDAPVAEPIPATVPAGPTADAEPVLASATAPTRARPVEPDVDLFEEEPDENALHFLGDLRSMIEPSPNGGSPEVAGEAGIGIAGRNLALSLHAGYGRSFAATARATFSLPKLVSIVGPYASVDAPVSFADSKARFGAGAALGAQFAATRWFEPFLEAGWRTYFGSPADSGHVMVGAGLRLRAR